MLHQSRLQPGFLIFVYGTLKQGGTNHQYLAKQRFVAPATTVAGYQLYALAGYPGMVRDPSAAEGVIGEIWEVDSTCLATLDDFEGVPEGLYRRTLVPLSPPHAELRVEAYLYARSVVGCQRIGPNWRVGA